MMYASMESCQDFSIDMKFPNEGVDSFQRISTSVSNARTTLASIYTNAPSLQCLELSFDPIPVSTNSWFMRLSQMIDHRIYWPNLKRLKSIGGWFKNPVFWKL